MSKDSPLIENEINDHKTDLNNWIGEVSKFEVPAAMRGVTERFTRDCQTLINDLESDKIPTADDLVDYVDSKNSLEIRFNAISENVR